MGTRSGRYPKNRKRMLPPQAKQDTVRVRGVPIPETWRRFREGITPDFRWSSFGAGAEQNWNRRGAGFGAGMIRVAVIGDETGAGRRRVGRVWVSLTRGEDYSISEGGLIAVRLAARNQTGGNDVNLECLTSLPPPLQGSNGWRAPPASVWRVANLQRQRQTRLLTLYRTPRTTAYSWSHAMCAD